MKAGITRTLSRLIAGAAIGLALGACAGTAVDTLPSAQAQPPAPKPVLSEAPAKLWSTPNRVAQRRTAAAPPRRRATSFTGPVTLPEVPYSNDQVVRNFIQIALRAEASDMSGYGRGIGVTKWVTPLRYSVTGARPRDQKKINTLIARLRLLTGADIAEAVDGPPNFRISFVPFRERDRTIDMLSSEVALGPAVGSMVNRWRVGENEKCLGLVSFHPNSSAIAKADILIKDELPPQIRNDCIVEEIVQSLGLMNDDPRVRPSIFNDDQQYHELTSHDEYLLRILYDPRIYPGMSAGEAMPMANRIIYQLRPPIRPTRGQV